jgi:hypothetical protein
MSFIDASVGPVLAHVVDTKYSNQGYTLVFALADMSFCVGYLSKKGQNIRYYNYYL